jgi:hypothetical protein
MPPTPISPFLTTLMATKLRLKFNVITVVLMKIQANFPQPFSSSSGGSGGNRSFF